MDFTFNEEQSSLADTVGQVLADFAGLTAPDPARSDDEAAWAALNELGLFALLVPEADDGVGLSWLDCALTIEALGAGLAPPIVASTLIGIEALNRLGSAAQKAAYMRRAVGGELRVALALDEIGQGDNPNHAQCDATGGKLNGQKITVAGADVADELIVSVSDNGQVGLLLVDAKADGVTITPHDSLDPSAGLCAVSFKNVIVPDGARLGQRFGGLALSQLLDLNASAQGLMATGIAARMANVAVEYAKTRQQFGQAIGAFQTIKHRCADMAVAVEAGSATAYYAAWAVSESANDQSSRASSAKAYCAEIARDVCNDTIQIHGGMGFTWELGLHRFLRRAKVMEISAGAPVWHYRRVLREDLAAKAVTATPEQSLPHANAA